MPTARCWLSEALTRVTPTPRAPHREAPSRGVLHLPRQQVAPMPHEATGVVRPRHVASSRAPGVRRWLESRRPAWTRPGGALDASVLPQSTALARTVTCPQRGHSTQRPSGSRAEDGPGPGISLRRPAASDSAPRSGFHGARVSVRTVPSSPRGQAGAALLLSRARCPRNLGQRLILPGRLCRARSRS